MGDELGGGVGAEQRERRIFARLDAPKRLERRRGGERVHPGETLVHDGAEREEIAPGVHALAEGLLGAHVPELALERLVARHVPGCLVERPAGLRDAELGDLDLAFERHEHVLRRDVAMHDAERPHALVAPPVRVIEPLGHLRRDVRAHLDRKRQLLAPRAREDRREVQAVHVLHRDVIRVGLTFAGGVAGRRLPEIEDLDDVRVRETNGELRLVHEHVDEVLAARELGQDSLDDEDLLEALDPVALGLEDLRHAALAEPFEKAVATEGGAHDPELSPIGKHAAMVPCRPRPRPSPGPPVPLGSASPSTSTAAGAPSGQGGRPGPYLVKPPGKGGGGSGWRTMYIGFVNARGGTGMKGRTSSIRRSPRAMT